MNQETISYEEMRNIKSNLESFADSMQEKFDAINKYFEGVGETGTVWKGDVAKQAKEVFDTTSKQFPDFIQSVRDEAKHLDFVIASFENADQISSSDLN